MKDESLVGYKIFEQIDYIIKQLKVKEKSLVVKSCDLMRYPKSRPTVKFPHINCPSEFYFDGVFVKAEIISANDFKFYLSWPYHKDANYEDKGDFGKFNLFKMLIPTKYLSNTLSGMMLSKKHFEASVKLKNGQVLKSEDKYFFDEFKVAVEDVQCLRLGGVGTKVFYSLKYLLAEDLFLMLSPVMSSHILSIDPQ